MAKASVTEKEVFAVCEELIREKQWPTPKLVLERLGVGSMTTVNALTAEWRTYLVERIASKTLDRDIPDVVLEAARALWAAAQSPAAEAAQAGLQGAYATLSAERAEYEREAAEVRRDAAEARELAQSEKQARLAIQGMLDDLRQASQTLSTRLSESERLAATLQERLDGVTTAREELAVQLEAERRGRAEDRDIERARSDAAERRIMERLEDERKRADSAEKRADAQTRAAEQLQGVIERTNEKLLQAERSAMQARTDADRTLEQLGDLQEELQTASVHAGEQSTRIAELTAELRQRAQELEAARESERRYREQVDLGIRNLLGWLADHNREAAAKTFEPGGNRQVAIAVEGLLRKV